VAITHWTSPVEAQTASAPRLTAPLRSLAPPVAAVKPATPAPASPYALSVATNRPEAIYKQGEPVAFAIKLLNGQQPVENAEVSWTLSKDGVPPVQTGSSTLVNGMAIVSGHLDEPGFLQCRVVYHAPEAPDKPVTAIGGAAIDPLRIKPSMPAPDDFDAFWDTQKKKLAAVPMNPRMTPVNAPVKGVECFDVQADSVGAPVSGYFARPVGAKAKSLPILLTVQGAGVRSSSLNGAASFAGQGMLAMDINAHGIPNGQPEQFYTDLANGDLKDYRTRGRDSRDTVYFQGMFLRLVRAIDFLTSQPEWDGRSVVVFGSSQGGAQALAAAGLDPRVTFFAAGIPAMCDHTGVLAGRVNGWPKMVPNGADGKPDLKVVEAARYYDAVNFARKTKAPGILAVGFIDTTCPPSTVYAAYNALSGEKDIVNQPLSSHQVTPAANEAMRHAIKAHLDAAKPQEGAAN